RRRQRTWALDDRRALSSLLPPLKGPSMQFLLRRLVFYLVALWAAISLNFLIPRLMPGDPVLLLVARLQGQMDPRAIAALRLQFGLNANASMWSQYVNYLNNL